MKPTPAKVSCPAIALADAEKPPEPPEGISLEAVMAALGKDGWQWLWAYKDYSNEQRARIEQTRSECRKTQ